MVSDEVQHGLQEGGPEGGSHSASRYNKGKAPRKHIKETNSTIHLGPFILLLAIQQAHLVGARLVTEMCSQYGFLDF